MANKSNKFLMYGGIAAIAILIFAIITGFNFGTLSITGERPSDIDKPIVPVVTCNSATSNVLSFSVYDEFGNSLTSDYNIWYTVNGAEKASQAASSTVTVAPSDVVAYRMIDKDGTHDVYGFSGSVVAECKTAQSIELTKGMQDTALSTTMYDISGGADTVNADGSAATVGAGATAKFKMYVAATTNDGVWSTSEQGRELGVAIDYNSLVYKQPIITSVSSGSFELLSGTPNGHTQSTGNSTAFYVVKSDALKDLGDLTLKFQAEAATGSTNPSAADGNISIMIYDKEMYQKLDRSWAIGFRNADTAADLGETNASDIFYAS